MGCLPLCCFYSGIRIVTGAQDVQLHCPVVMLSALSYSIGGSINAEGAGRIPMKEALAAAGMLVLLALALYFPALSGHWRWDDPQLLLHGLRFSIFEELGNPQVWRQISTANLMPWQDISIELDLILFGLTPGLFYLHHLLALAAAGLALYACLRLWVERLPAAGGALLFMLGAPVLLASEQLMTRH